jgi:hypothetical protein
MGLIVNGAKMGKPYINGAKHNAFIGGQKIWNDVPPIKAGEFMFYVEDEGAFYIPVCGVNGGTSTYQSYNWVIDWGDGTTQTASGTGSVSKNIVHYYSDEKSGHYITIKPNGAETQGWFNAFGASPSTSEAIMGKIKRLFSPITPLMRTMNDYAYYYMFHRAGITSIPSGFLPATTLAPACYANMFYNSKLAAIPSDLLPATTLASNCYNGMFFSSGVTSLPANLLPATKLAPACYANMFYDSKLAAIPSGLLPATTLAQDCYNTMFGGCTDLHSLPSGLLPATTLAPSCYANMFYRSDLIALPANLLPATTLVAHCYISMFEENTNLTNIGNINTAWFSGKAVQPYMFEDDTKIATPITYAQIPSGWK